MLKNLSIDNFALIDKASIDFCKGYTVITGETGSGKSILLNALNLVLGERADYSVIGPAKNKAVVEALINIKGFGLGAFFKHNDLDYSDETLIRREINSEGRSRAFVNDSPVQLNVLRELGSRLIHIHSQYNTLELKDPAYQLELLDTLAGTGAKKDIFTRSYLELQSLRQEKDRLQNRAEIAQKDKDYLEFQLTELNQLDLDNLNFEDLENQLKVYEAGDELKVLLEELVAINGGEGAMLSKLTEIKSRLYKKQGISESIDNLRERFESVLIDLTEITHDASDALNDIQLDPIEMARLGSLLDEYNRILFKYKKRDQEELRNYRNELRSQSFSAEESELRLAELERLIEDKQANMAVIGNELHELRSTAAKEISSKLKDELELLKLPDCRFEFQLNRLEEPIASGYTAVTMLFSPNPGIDPVPIQKAASGGELSRVMLALQYLISQKTQLQSILFDEIDTGVSGDVASRIGDTLRKMGETMQVIAITHLPQVAGKGEVHLSVSKKVMENGRMNTFVRTLSTDERIDEIARLMSGDVISEGARSNAKTLLGA